jgi:hypothetical protein
VAFVIPGTGAHAGYPTTERLSVDRAGWRAMGTPCRLPSRPTGVFVAFVSDASNLVRHDTNDAWDVFVRDRTFGTTRRVNVTAHGAEADANNTRNRVGP